MVGTPGHVRQQGLSVGESLATADAGVEVDGATDEVDHLHLRENYRHSYLHEGDSALPVGKNLNSSPASV